MGTTTNGNMETTGPQYVHQSSLDKLKCTKCNQHLSIFPIHRNNTGNLTLCGRCLSNDHPDFTRDELIERALEYQRFACIYKKSGCLEALIPSQMKIHEAKCRFQKYKCPTIHNDQGNKCMWQGSIDKIIGHFEKEHPIFLLLDRFEVDFVHTHCENYLMPFGDELFVVTREAQSGPGTFSVKVSYLGVNPDVENYSFELTLENTNKKQKHTIGEVVGNKIELNKTAVSKLLLNPNIIVASLNIVSAQPGKRLPSSSSAMDIKEENFDVGDLTTVECPICFIYMISPIYQCTTGHSICEECMKAQKDCPTCHSTLDGKTRNFSLERLIMTMIYPCKNASQGCKFTTQAKDMRRHEATCIFGPFECPLKDYENCNSVFPVMQLSHHIKSLHYESLQELDSLSIPYDVALSGDIDDAYILQYNNFLFRLSFAYKNEEKKFMWAVQLVGPVEECTRYSYELDIVDVYDRHRRYYIKGSCSPLTDKNQIFQNDQYVFLYYDQISKFINKQLTFRLCISHKQ